MPSRLDILMMASIVVSFATFITAHVALIAGLVTRPPRSRGLVAFFVPVLAPYWGLRERMRGRSVVWILALVVYVGARVAEHVVMQHQIR